MYTQKVDFDLTSDFFVGEMNELAKVQDKDGVSHFNTGNDLDYTTRKEDVQVLSVIHFSPASLV